VGWCAAVLRRCKQCLLWVFDRVGAGAVGMIWSILVFSPLVDSLISLWLLQLYRRLQIRMWKKLMNIDRFCIHFSVFWLQIIETSKKIMNIDLYCIYFSFFVLGFLCIKYVSLRSFSYFFNSCYVCTELHDVLPSLNFTCVCSQSCFCHMSCCTSWISASHMIRTILFAARVHLEVLLISVLTSQTK
jgi:hypothetical protein